MQKQYYDNNPPPPCPPLQKRNLFYSKSLKAFKSFVFTTCFQLQFLTNELTSVHDSGAYLIEYVFEFYFQ